MKLLRFAFKRQTAMSVLALTFASAASVALVAARIVWTGRFGYSFLVWNLFLAWLPMVFALLASENYHSSSGRDWRFLGLAGAPEPGMRLLDVLFGDPQIPAAAVNQNEPENASQGIAQRDAAGSAGERAEKRQ